MTQRCAQIINGVVTNIIVADPQNFDPGDGSLIVASDVAQVGWTYAGGAFTAVTPTSVPQTSGLSFLQFMALFTPAEQASVVNSTDTQLRIFVMMATGAGQLDLTNPEVIGGVNYLASLGVITAPRVAVILSGVTP